MEINSEDATTIVRTIRQNLERLGIPELHDEVLHRISRDEHVTQSEAELIEPKQFLENYIVTLTWLLRSYNPALAGRALQHLQQHVDGNVQDVLVDLGPNPFTGEPTAIPLQDLVPNYSGISDELRTVLAKLELRYHEPPAPDFDGPDEGFDKERPPL
jgi:hypothetical protein